jgi:hypothetical protein
MAGSNFFATPEEQYSWLKQFFQPDVIWCCVRDKTRHPYRWWTVHSAEDFETFAHQAPSSFAVSVVLGRYDRSAPVWRTVRIINTGEEYENIEFLHSQGIQIYLSVYSSQADEKVLFEGSIGIMRRVWYQDAGIDPEPLYRWYRQVKRQWWKMMDSRYTPVYRGIAVRRPIPIPDPYAAVSYGAVQWCLAGGRLKSATTYAVYDVVPKEEAKEYERALRLFQCPEGTQRCRRCRGSGEISLHEGIQSCRVCEGSGCAPESINWCVRCEGSGSVWVPTESGGLTSQDCPDCGGLGFVS